MGCVKQFQHLQTLDIWMILSPINQIQASGNGLSMDSPIYINSIMLVILNNSHSYLRNWSYHADFFRYLQLRDFLLKHKDWDKVVKPTQELLIKVQTKKWDKKLISCYQIFLSMDLNNTAQVKERWEIEIYSNISHDMW